MNISEVTVFDDGQGVIFEFMIVDGIAIRMYLDDEVAQQMVNTVQNKLNERWKP